jgi:glycosyltransferase involved in cell wall biosynthesis
MEAPQISVIISTYNAEAWLEKVLWGYNCQIFKDFEVVIADDGSGPATKALLHRMKDEVFYKLVHVWQEDDGFQKSRILNKAITTCSAPYIVMSDGDCIPRADFLEVHNTNKQKGYFISGGYFMLPMNISKQITKEDIDTGNCFDVQWLLKHGLKPSFKNNKLTATGWKSRLLNSITPTNASWNGHNASGWKEDIVAVNGFDERMQYGGQDRELGERLFNYGIKSKQLRYSAVCVHLDHKRGYKTPESIAKNQAIRKHTRKSKSPWTPYGIVKEEGGN